MRKRIARWPVVGSVLRWFYGLIHLLRLKEEVYTQREELDSLRRELRLHLVHSSASMAQRVDQLIYDLGSAQESRHNPMWDDYYRVFEEQFRGSREQISARYLGYLEYLPLGRIKKALDIGCGRGEWVQILQQRGIEALGVDLNLAMISEAQKAGLKNVKYADAIAYLDGEPTGKLDLISAFHLIEHLPFEQLLALISSAYWALSSGGTFLLESPNPENLLVGAYTFYKDPTHRNPLPSEVVAHMLRYFGFEEVRIHLLHPFPESMQVAENSVSAQRINHLFYGPQDYLVVATKP